MFKDQFVKFSKVQKYISNISKFIVKHVFFKVNGENAMALCRIEEKEI